MSKNNLLQWLEKNADVFEDVAKKIWENPEVGYNETFASDLQMKVMKEAGFRIAGNTGGVQTAFVAEYGAGKPVIGILGEFDALPGLSQKVSPVSDPVVTGGPGHGCGHNLLGTGGVAAAMALKELIAGQELQGTIRYYGCPAEELLSGKTYMARAGAFDDLDCALTWHPGNMNVTANISMTALTAVEFHFTGITAHAAAAPHLGRSALDAVELMNVGANYLREHVPDGTRIHYQITNGGLAPNIVPDEASVYYFLRSANRKQVDELYERIVKVAKGAAMMTDTSVTWTIKAGCYDMLPNIALNELMFNQTELTGAIAYTDEERKFAADLLKSLDPAVAEASRKQNLFLGVEDSHLPGGFIHDLRMIGMSAGGSSDVGDVSWIVPVGQVLTVCAPAGIQVHTWQATASFGSSIGFKGMHYASKIMALAAYDLFQNEDGILDKAKAEFASKTQNFTFKAGIPDEIQPPAPAKQPALTV